MSSPDAKPSERGLSAELESPTARARRIFEEVDVDSDGSLSTTELRAYVDRPMFGLSKYLTSKGVADGEAAAARMLAALDTVGSRQISLQEWLLIFTAAVPVPDVSASPGDVLCDEDGCYLMLDTVSDGLVDTVIPIGQSLPGQALAQRLIINPAFELFSVVSTVLLIVTFAISYGELTPAVRAVVDLSDIGCSSFFVFEFLARWWAVGLARRHLFRPLTFLDFINVLPILVSPGLPYVPSTPLAGAAVSSLSNTALAPLAPLRLLRAARILRLRRLLQPEELSRIARTLTGDPDLAIKESTRVALRLAFSALSIVVIGAGFLWQLERATNPDLDGFLDGVPPL